MRFYLLRKADADTPTDRLAGTNALKEEGFATGEALRCPNCNRFLTMLRWLPPYRVKLETWGKEYGDFADVGDEMIVSERFAQAFRATGLKGLSVFEAIEVLRVVHHRGPPRQPLPRYFKATVTLSSTTVDQRASGYVWTDESKVCPVCLFDELKFLRRIVIKQDTWNGDDIFFPRGGTRLMVSERFKSFCEKHGLSGAAFDPPDQERSYYDWETHDCG
jgi:hypothetical protein